MLSIKGNDISLTQGDTAYLNVVLFYGNNAPKGTPYEFHDGDTITLSIKRNILDEDYTLQKKVNAGEIIVFTPDDTENLGTGKYVYDVQLDTVNKERFTVVPTSNFYLMRGVTE